MINFAWDQPPPSAESNTRSGCKCRAVDAGLLILGGEIAGVTQGFGQEDCRKLVLAALERGNVDLVVSIYRAVSSPNLASSDSGGPGSGGMWPAADLSIVTTIVLGLARCSMTALLFPLANPSS